MDNTFIHVIISITTLAFSTGVAWGILENFKVQTKEDIKALYLIARNLEIENNNIKVKFETIIATLRLHEEMTKLNEIAAKGNWERIFDVINKNERKLEELIKKYNDL